MTTSTVFLTLPNLAMIPPSQPPAPALPFDEASAWQQVLERDARAEGAFVYAVRSTGIYCRPTCASRRPRRENVQFFPSAAAAETAGFRACLRCEPDRTGAKADPHTVQVARAAALLAGLDHPPLDLAALARAVGLGRFALLRSFRRVLGVTPAEYARQRRQERLRDALQTRAGRVTDAVYEAGFGSPSRVYEAVDATLGMSPTAMRAGGEGETLHYAIGDSPLGCLLVAGTARGLSAVLFADDPAAAERDLHERLPRATLLRDDAALQSELQVVLSRLTETPSAAALPFHVRATAFQQRVWTALVAIPRGETRTYAQVAQAIGAPKAVRAVGAACGANPLALVVPCHRVVGVSGDLTGYRWGKDRKRALLALERAER